MGTGDAVGSGDHSLSIVSADASPLIALDRIGRLDLLERLSPVVSIPPAVADEVGPVLAALPWISVRAIARPMDRRVIQATLGRGEREVIALALEVGAQRIVVDDLPARQLAARFGLPVVGTVGVVVIAKLEGAVPAVEPIIEGLLATGFRISRAVYDAALIDAGERR